MPPKRPWEPADPDPVVQHAVPEVPPEANLSQVGGDHYRHLVIQPWDFILQNGLGWAEGTIVKYVVRWREKNGLEDLLKARHVLDKLIELESKR